MDFLKIDGWEDPEDLLEKKLDRVASKLQGIENDYNWCIGRYTDLTELHSKTTAVSKLKKIQDELDGIVMRLAYQRKKIIELSKELEVIIKSLRDNGGS
jgi:hypothetical protein